ncbi:MAG: hypothetical protein ABIJ56_11680 [Pseudomonadota bacterium]
MADEKKKPPSNVEELKARLGLLKKPDKTSRPPGSAGHIPVPGIPGGGHVPGVQPPGLSPPPFLQQQQKPPVDSRRDPFSKDAGTEYIRQSLLEGPKAEDMAVSVDDQKKIAARSRNLTIAVAVAVGIACLLAGMFWGRGFSSRLIYNRSVDDGIDLYDIVQHSSKTLSEVKTKMVGAQQKAGKNREPDYALMNEMKELFKSQACKQVEEGKEICVLRLADLANRSYNIYKPDIVQTLFTYASQWNDLLSLMKEHATRTKNDQPALDLAKSKIEGLISTDYGVVFNSQRDPGTEQVTVYGNLAVIAAPIMGEGGMVTGFQMQGGVGYPAVEKQLYSSGDLAAAPETWMVPLGPGSKEGVLAKAQIDHFIEYQKRLQIMIDLANQMDQNQKSLLISIGEIASLDKQFAL